MSKLGSASLVTYYTKYCNELDPHFANVPSENKAVIHDQNKCWNVVWWNGRLA